MFSVARLPRLFARHVWLCSLAVTQGESSKCYALSAGFWVEARGGGRVGRSDQPCAAAGFRDSRTLSVHLIYGRRGPLVATEGRGRIKLQQGHDRETLVRALRADPGGGGGGPTGMAPSHLASRCTRSPPLSEHGKVDLRAVLRTKGLHTALQRVASSTTFFVLQLGATRVSSVLASLESPDWLSAIPAIQGARGESPSSDRDVHSLCRHRRTS
jgi:hypothetical protein